MGTPKWDCAAMDNSQVLAVNADGTMIDGNAKERCAQECIKDQQCVSFNWPSPGDGYCYIKRGQGLREKATVNGVSKTCGGPTDYWDYYTLLTNRSDIPLPG